MTVGIYIRVSTLEQAIEGYSIAAQKERLIAYCAAQGWTDYKLYVDEGVSAKGTDREQLNLLLEHVKAEQIGIILVYRLDRFTRSVKDLYNLLETLEKHKCTFKSATEMIDTSTAMGRMFIGLVALLAQWESENLSERVQMALDKKVSSGEHAGNTPYGFDQTSEDKLVLNDKASVVLDMIDKIKNGMSANQVAKYLNQINHDRNWHPQAVLRILKNPALYGAKRWNDKVYENTHKGLISKDEFIKLQEILEDRSKHHRRDVKNSYLFQGVLSCPSCDNILAVNRHVREKKNGELSQGAVYKCNWCYKEGRKSKQVGEKRFLEALYEYMKNVKIKHIEPIHEEKTDERKALLNQLELIEKKREKYQRGWAADLITDQEFKQRMEETRKHYDTIKEKLSQYKAPVQIDTEAIKRIVYTFNQTFAFLSQEEKRMFVSQFIRKIEYKLVPQPPKRPDRAKVGKDLVVITNVEFY
ncbi:MULTISPECIES: recombinase family protein [Bacillus]|uniref:recombinase family protein n=1 Tax=Bacillus TaxID=1386 RepID=UPI000E518B63|nr:recombinase family protein [Bacillus sonorensis]RHJ10752.1 recombinase family protein [Bacillus sonorensis]